MKSQIFFTKVIVGGISTKLSGITYGGIRIT